MAQIIWTESALQDLNDIAEYIAIENVVAAEQLVETVFACIFRDDLASDFGMSRPPISVSSGH